MARRPSGADKGLGYMMAWRADWNMFVRDVLGARLDPQQREIIAAVQECPRVAVASGTARGKDYVAACACLCFLYLTPRFDASGRLAANTKVAMTAPTGRQVSSIMMPEIARLFSASGVLPGRLTSEGVRTGHAEWFLSGFKADDRNTEAWSGFHAVNTMFAVTEASGIGDEVFHAIEGNLQGNSRLLLVFNPNRTTGYAAEAMKGGRFRTFRLSSLDAPNVVEGRQVFPGQVNRGWVEDKVRAWCSPLGCGEAREEGDFEWEGGLYRPNDLFRVKVLGMFPRVPADALIPYEWVEAANRRWQEGGGGGPPRGRRRLGVDVAGMGRDCTVVCERVGDRVLGFTVHQSGGRADHMHVAGMVSNMARGAADVCVDTIGEGAGVYSRLAEMGVGGARSCKFSRSAGGLSDETGQFRFANMRAWCYWAVRDWLDPRNGYGAALPPDAQLLEEAVAVRWQFHSNGSIIIEPKEGLSRRLRRSPDRLDALALTFFPSPAEGALSDGEIEELFL